MKLSQELSREADCAGNTWEEENSRVKVNLIIPAPQMPNTQILHTVDISSMQIVINRLQLFKTSPTPAICLDAWEVWPCQKHITAGY